MRARNSILWDTARFPTRFDGVVDPRDDRSFQRDMRDSFIATAEQTVGSSPIICNPDVVAIGFEIEYSLVDDELNPAPESVRDACESEFKGFAAPELGAHQFEITTEAFDVRGGGVARLLEQWHERERAAVSWLAERGVHMLRLGADPLTPLATVARTSTKDKYELCPNFHNGHKRVGHPRYIGGGNGHPPIDVSDAALLSLTNAVQVTVDCHGLDHAIAMLNRSLAVAPLVTALGAHAGIVDGTDSGYADFRFVGWEISHDIRSWAEYYAGRDTRVGLPSRYYRDVSDYLSSVLSHPFFMRNDADGAAFGMGIGIYWRDARLKFLKKDSGVLPVVEFRPVSVQPTIEDDLAVMLFYVGRTWLAQDAGEPLLPIHLVRANKAGVMVRGLDAEVWVSSPNGLPVLRPAREALVDEVALAAQGLDLLGVSALTVSEVEHRLLARLSRGAPIDTFRAAVAVEQRRGASTAEAVRQAVRACNLLVNSIRIGVTHG